MERLERLVVHMEEAFTMRGAGDVAHLRLGLMLFDSAAELMMHRACAWPLELQHMNHRQLAQWDAIRNRAREQGTELPESVTDVIRDLREETLSKARLRSVERDFNAKAQFLETEERMDARLVRVLGKLHQYRNETYHRDTLREDSLASAVTIYAHVATEMMGSLTPDGFGYSFGQVIPATFDKYQLEGGLSGMFAAQREIAAQLAAANLDHADTSVAEALSVHVLGRLASLVEEIDFCQSALPDIHDRDSLLAMVRNDANVGRAGVRHEAASRPAFTLARIEEWKRRAARIADVHDRMDAFAAFADLEDDFEPLEAAIQELSMAIDEEIQSQIDIARGK